MGFFFISSIIHSYYLRNKIIDEKEENIYLVNVSYENRKNLKRRERNMKVEQNDYTWEEHMIESIKKLDKNTPEGSIIDPDTLLADILDEADHEVSGLAREIFEIFKKSADKESIKELFFAFTGVEFNNFLNKCIKESGFARDFY